jgi:hypothetical protein
MFLRRCIVTDKTRNTDHDSDFIQQPRSKVALPRVSPTSPSQAQTPITFIFHFDYQNGAHGNASGTARQAKNLPANFPT